MTHVLWSGWVSAFWVGEENWAFRDIWRQVIWCLEPACDAFWVGISPLEMRDDKSWHYVWFSLMLWQAGSDLTELSEVLRPRVGRTAVIKIISVKIPEMAVSAAKIVVRFLSVSSNSMSISKNISQEFQCIFIFMFSQAADGLFYYIKRISP